MAAISIIYPAILRSFDPETGAMQWQWDSRLPPELRTAATGGMTWMTGTYDPDLQSALLGHRQSDSRAEWATRAPATICTPASIVALNPDTGKLVWAFQPSPHDTHDWDAVETPVLVDADFPANRVRC